MYSTELNHTKSDLRNLLNRQCLVYCLYALGDSKYILLNRDYKPLGYTGDYMAWVDYDDYPQLTLPPLPPELMGRLKVNACGTVYLFDDNSSPLLTTAPVRAVRQYYWNVAFLSHFIASSVAAKKEQFTHCVSGDKRSVQCELDRCCLVYLLKEVGDSKYILLNRRYKPLGHVGRSWVDYNDYPQLTLPSLPPRIYSGIHKHPRRDVVAV